MLNKAGLFFVVSAPSGTGKTTLVNRLLAEFPKMSCSVSCTTRPPRNGEKEGVDYYFIRDGKFREMADQGLFFEWEEVHGAFYGTPKAPILKRRDDGLDTIFDVDTRGALSIKKAYPDSCLIFLMPPSMDALEQRLRLRKTEEEGSLKKRMENARREMAEKDKFDYVIINDDLDRAYEELKGVISEQRRVSRRSER